MRPKALVLRTAGSNCDAETAFAFEKAGAAAERIHLNRILESPATLDQYQLWAIPGGFSYGDDIAAGKIFANQLMHHLRDAVARFVAAGKPVIGICNGFQVLVKTDLLPGSLGERAGQTATLTNNDSGRFVDRWIHLVPRSKKCIWTRDLEPLDLPVAHGEGKFAPADEAVRKAIWENDQVALIYARADNAPANGQFPENPNGSVDDIAGICDSTGLVLGLMPHPERYASFLNHPSWSKSSDQTGVAPGLRFFINAVNHVRQSL